MSQSFFGYVGLEAPYVVALYAVFANAAMAGFQVYNQGKKIADMCADNASTCT